MIFKRIDGRLVNVNHIVEIEARINEDNFEKFRDAYSRDILVPELEVYIEVYIKGHANIIVNMNPIVIKEICNTKEFKDIKSSSGWDISFYSRGLEDIFMNSIAKYFNTHLKEKYENDFVQKYIEGER
ncbi:MAG: hypothetical protein ACRDDY_04235 [Clostridium sp.]|uniref:hypothetical protein n=1 Tax=Clostridium sp. TaxID=1506 RepID=UPI003EE6ED0F